MARKKRGTAAAEHADEPRITPAKAKNYLKVAKAVGPTVIPVVAPLAVHVAGLVRDRYDRYRAHRIGVPVERLAEFTGKGAALHARIAGIGSALRELRDNQGTADNQRFVDEKSGTVQQLAAAVRAAERMPTARRRAAHEAIAAHLDQIESELLRRLGV